MAHALPTFDDPLTATIAAFLTSIGLDVSRAELDDESFLPGILIERGSLLVDPERLRYPGDLLHEAGHLAVLPPTVRPAFGSDAAPPDIDVGQLEVQAIAWSYAAALHLRFDPALVFHDGGYRGHARGLLASFSVGVYYGASDLERLGLAAAPRRAAELGIAPYPHMIKWLRD